MTAPGVGPKKTGTRLKRGQALQVMTYPRARTKALLVQVAREIGRPLSSFMIMAALMAAAKLRGREIGELIPADELRLYRTARVYRKRGTHAKRGSRAKRTSAR
jgi:hypothetical protein